MKLLKVRWESMHSLGREMHLHGCPEDEDVFILNVNVALWSSLSPRDAASQDTPPLTAP